MRHRTNANYENLVIDKRIIKNSHLYPGDTSSILRSMISSIKRLWSGICSYHMYHMVHIVRRYSILLSRQSCLTKKLGARKQSTPVKQRKRKKKILYVSYDMVHLVHMVRTNTGPIRL